MLNHPWNLTVVNDPCKFAQLIFFGHRCKDIQQRKGVLETEVAVIFVTPLIAVCGLGDQDD